jgi:hypothetical protein
MAIASTVQAFSYMQRNYVAMPDSVDSVPSNHNLIADALSRFGVPVKTEWELHPVIFQAITLQTGGKQIYQGAISYQSDCLKNYWM